MPGARNTFGAVVAVSAFFAVALWPGVPRAGDVDAILDALARDRNNMPATLESGRSGTEELSPGPKEVNPGAVVSQAPFPREEESPLFFPSRRTPGRIIFSGDLR